ncbi:NAD(P)(+) transhydrogenase (Re/Si-specific) subunit alpha, partial [Nocardia sp. NPDC055029]
METTHNVGEGSPRGARVGVVRESGAGERRVALVPKIIPALSKQGVEVVVEAGAGLGALIPDAA